MADHLLLRILTPVREVFSGEVETVTLTALDGEIGVLPGHAPLLAQLRPGEASVRENGRVRYFALADGFVEVADDTVTALVRAAETAEEIDTVRAERRRLERERQLAETEASERRMREAEISLAKQLVRLHVARRGGG